jgi:hypothetical protein
LQKIGSSYKLVLWPTLFALDAVAGAPSAPLQARAACALCWSLSLAAVVRFAAGVAEQFKELIVSHFLTDEVRTDIAFASIPFIL